MKLKLIYVCYTGLGQICSSNYSLLWIYSLLDLVISLLLIIICYSFFQKIVVNTQYFILMKILLIFTNFGCLTINCLFFLLNFPVASTSGSSPYKNFLKLLILLNYSNTTSWVIYITQVIIQYLVQTDFSFKYIFGISTCKNYYLFYHWFAINYW